MTQSTQIIRRPLVGAVQYPQNPLLERVYQGRAIDDVKELDYQLKSLLPPTMLGLDAAAARLYQALLAQQKILIIGDFDADGATSTALLLKLLPQFGFLHVDYLVPNRFDYGYGLSVGIVEEAKRQFAPDLIITVDNGIANHEGAARAYNLNMEVIITDHHLPAATLPQAAAIVNPNQHGDPFPSKNLAGVGVAFYLCVALRAYLRQQNYFNQNIKEPDLRQVLDLVALGTVADVVCLDHNNRLLVAQGLHLIRQQKCALGISAIFKIAKRDQEFAQAQDMAFAIAPRLNAAGRLEDMGIGIECLRAPNWQAAEELAQMLDDINHERREIEANMKRQALQDLAAMEDIGSQMEAGLCLYHPNWHQGVVGILAGRIKERYGRPTIIFAKEDDDHIKGSARSISGVHIRDALADINAEHPHLMTKFGGHAMAAGLSMPLANFDKFARIFADKIASLDVPLGSKTILSDGALNEAQMTLLSADQLVMAGPFGHGFAAPLFDGQFTLVSRRVLKNAHLKVQLGLGSAVFEGIAFNETGEHLPEIANLKVEVAYSLDINRYNGRQNLQLMIELIRPLTAAKQAALS